MRTPPSSSSVAVGEADADAQALGRGRDVEVSFLYQLGCFTANEAGPKDR